MPQNHALRVSFKLDKVICHAQQDPVVGGVVGTDLDSEPFLLTFFFAIDGPGVKLNTAFKLEGKARTFAGPGTHGNLKDDSVSAGDHVPIPPAIGQWTTVFSPITLPDPCDVLLPGGVPGGIGVVFALMEQGLESDEGMEAAHQAFNDTLTSILNNEIIPSISLENTSGQVSEEQKKKFADQIRKRMTEALVTEQAKQPLRNEITGVLEQPELLGFDVVVYTHSDWIADPKPPATKTIKKRFDASTGAPAGNDWEINGTVTAAPTCSATTVASAGAASSNKQIVSPKHMAMLRTFRDKELARQPRLRGLVSLAGNYTPQIAAVLEEDPALRERAQRALAAVAEASKGGDVKLTAEHIQTAQLVLGKVRQQAPGAKSRKQLALLAGAAQRMKAGTVPDLIKHLPPIQIRDPR